GHTSFSRDWSSDVCSSDLLPRVLISVSKLVCVTASASEEAISVSRFGNINPIPFRGKQGVIESRFQKAFAYPLGPTDPCSTAVHMEPFSTSVLKVLT